MITVAALVGITTLGVSTLRPAPAATLVNHYEYVIDNVGNVYVYDMDRGHAPVPSMQFSLPAGAGVRGVVASAATGKLYASYGGWGGGRNGSLAQYDLVRKMLDWTRSYPFGVDSMAISADGQTIYMPTGENDTGNRWEVLDVSSTGRGNPVGTMHGGAGPHNTLVGPSGRVYLGSRANAGGSGADRLYVYNGASPYSQLSPSIGTLKKEVRPFTINHSETLAFTTASAFLGFQVSSITSGKVLYTVSASNPCRCSGSFSTPSHGIAISPDETEAWLVDSANMELHVFDISRLPGTAPHEIYAYPLQPGDSFSGNETPPNPVWDGKIGWVNMSRDGRFVYAGDGGEAINRGSLTQAPSLAAKVPALRNSRQNIEIDWSVNSSGVFAPVAAFPRESLGFASVSP